MYTVMSYVTLVSHECDQGVPYTETTTDVATEVLTALHCCFIDISHVLFKIISQVRVYLIVQKHVRI